MADTRLASLIVAADVLAVISIFLAYATLPRAALIWKKRIVLYKQRLILLEEGVEDAQSIILDDEKKTKETNRN